MSYSGSEGKQMVTWVRTRGRDEKSDRIQEAFWGITYVL